MKRSSGSEGPLAWLPERARTWKRCEPAASGWGGVKLQATVAGAPEGELRASLLLDAGQAVIRVKDLLDKAAATPLVVDVKAIKTADSLHFDHFDVRLAELAQRDGTTRVPIVPTGFAYEPLPGNRWQVVIRFGQPIWLDDPADAARVARVVEDQVRYLSSAAEPVGAAIPQEAVSS